MHVCVDGHVIRLLGVLLLVAGAPLLEGCVLCGERLVGIDEPLRGLAVAADVVYACLWLRRQHRRTGRLRREAKHDQLLEKHRCESVQNEARRE